MLFRSIERVEAFPLRLRVKALRIGPSICPGVPWTQAEGRPLWLALKSGNFGGPDFFDEALKMGASAS